MRARRFRRLRLFGAVAPLLFSVGCLDMLLGNRQIERDLARTMLDIERIYQTNAETQQRVDAALAAIQTKSQADTELIIRNLIELEQRIDALQETLGIVRSQIEEVRYQMVGEGADRVAIQVGQGNDATTAVLEGGELLLEGQTALRRENHEQARASFQEFLNRFPASPRAAEAQMRIGDAYYREAKWAEARAAYERVETQYLTSPRVPEALMKMAYCEEQLGRTAPALAILERLLQNHAEWEQIQRARDMMRRLIQLEPIVPPPPAVPSPSN